MPPQDQLLSRWLEWKSTSAHYFRLQRDVFQDFDYTGPQWGHPSNYAATRFQCEPADSLVFVSRARWPAHLSLSYRADVEQAIERAVVDSLMSAFCPYRGCKVSLIEVGWDDVMSSEMSFYRAAKGAMDELRSTHEWQLVTVPQGPGGPPMKDVQDGPAQADAARLASASLWAGASGRQ